MHYYSKHSKHKRQAIVRKHWGKLRPKPRGKTTKTVAQSSVSQGLDDSILSPLLPEDTVLLGCSTHCAQLSWADFTWFWHLQFLSVSSVNEASHHTFMQWSLRTSIATCSQQVSIFMKQDSSILSLIILHPSKSRGPCGQYYQA